MASNSTTSNTSSTTNSEISKLYRGGSTALSSKTKSAADTKDQFLQLLVAQMKNQDPLNPLDNAQVTSQMAQISTVEGIEKLNSTMGQFAQSTSGSAANSTEMVGKTILAEGNKLTWNSGDTAMQAGVSLATNATKVAVQLLNASGVVVDTKTFTNQPAGTLAFSWTGTNNSNDSYGSGSYMMRIAAVDANGKTVSASPLATTTVTSVTQSNGAVMAQLANGTAVKVSEIKGVF